MYVYEFETQHWSRVDCTAGDAPSGRSSLVAQAHEGSLWIFGGYNGNTVLNDFYKFRLSAICVPPTRLVSDFRRLLHNASDFASDVTFRVDGKSISAHRAILAIRSEYFRVLLCGGYMRESSSYQPTSATTRSSTNNDDEDAKRNNQSDNTTKTATTDGPESPVKASPSSCKTKNAKSSASKQTETTSDSAIDVPGGIEIQDVSYEVFLMVLEFLYTDTVCELTSSSSSSSLELGIHLLIASERFMLDRLKALCEDVIRKQVHVDNVMAILVASHVYNAKSLKDLTLDFILRHLQHPTVMNGLSDLRSEPDLLLEIIKRNSGNQSYTNNNQNSNHHHHQQYPQQYHPHQHSQRQQQQYENLNHHSSTSLSLYQQQHQHHHHDAASAANAGAGGVAATAAVNNRVGGVNDNSFNFDNGIGGGGDARQQQQDYSPTSRSSALGPFGSDWSRR
jgi:BTB/POZ domain/Galactose oxidase, central domain